MSVNLQIEFGGGLETLFGGVKRHQTSVTATQPNGSVLLSDVLNHMRDEMLTERPELFMQNETVRPGILVLINDADWELQGGLESEIENNDKLVFISTLHGG